MKTHQTSLGSLRLQALEMPGTNVVTVLILVKAGSRYERKKDTGISHFLEHMFFKGAKKYQTPKAVSEAIDSFGGAFNAFTGKEYVGYYVKSGKSFLEKSLDVLSDMLQHAKIPPEELEKERGVILEEMAMYLDAPMYQISWDFERLVFGDQPLGWDQIGTKENIKSFKREDLLAYKEDLYTAPNMVVTCAGAVTEKTLTQMGKFFAHLPTHSPKRKPAPFDPTLATETFFHRKRRTEQFHLSFGVRAYSEQDPRYPALKLLATILGGNMSSRMFLSVREEKGLCYSIHTQVDEYTDTGLLTTRAGVRLEDILKALTAIREEYDRITQGDITDKELEKAKNYLCGKTDLQTEDTEAVAHEYGKNLLLYEKEESFHTWKERLRATPKSEVIACAQELLTPGRFRLALIGPDTVDKEKIHEILH